MNSQFVTRQIAIANQRNRDKMESQRDFQSSNYLAKGKFLVVGVGEVFKDIKFPVTFIEQPSFFSGGALEDSQATKIGFMPTFSCIVLSWQTEQHGIDTILYKGARLCVVTTGTPDTIQMWVNWHFMGKALVNPVGNLDNVDGAI